MSAATLIKRLLEQRDSLCELEPAAEGKPALAVMLRRPAEAELPNYRPQAGKSMRELLVDAVCHQAVDWRGFSEAELLGASVGSSDEIAFDPDLWAVVVRDKQAWLSLCAAHLMQAINDHLARQGAAEKNSSPSLMPRPASSTRAKRRPNPTPPTSSP